MKSITLQLVDVVTAEVKYSRDVTGLTDLQIVEIQEEAIANLPTGNYERNIKESDLEKDSAVIFLPFTDFGYNRMRSGDYKISFKTDQLTPEKLVQVDSIFNSSGIVLVRNSNQITANEVKALDELDPDEFGGKAKSQSLRIRNHLFRLWKYNNHGYTEAKDFYKARTEKFLQGLRDEMEQYD